MHGQPVIKMKKNVSVHGLEQLTSILFSPLSTFFGIFPSTAFQKLDMSY
jgi:hypothetical protein